MFNNYQKILKDIFYRYPGYAYWLDRHGCYLGCSETYLRLVGLKNRKVIKGLSIKQLPYFKDKLALADTIQESDLQVIHTASPKVTEEQWLINNEPRYFTTSRLALWNITGHVNGLLVIATDITSHHNQQAILMHKAEEAELTLDNIVANMPGHVYWKNNLGIYLGCNNRQAQSLGLNSAKEVIGKADVDLPWHGSAAETFRENDLRIIESGNTEIFEEEAMIENQPAIVLSQKAPLRDKHNRTVGVLGISIDITKQKKTEQELIVAKEMADEANRLKIDFIHNMEHDIRTPFTGIYGMAQALADIETDPMKKTMLTDIINCAKELLDYNNGILDFARIESGALPVLSKKFSLRRLITKLAAMESPPAKVKNLDFITTYADDAPDVVIGDRARIQRILINLVSNAIKFTNEGFVKVAVELCKMKNNNTAIIRLIVEDSGIGIPEGKQQTIYETFTRLVPANLGVYKGHGLGLRIVKKFTDELEGELDVTSKPNGGTKFYCTLPLRLPLTDDILDETALD